ncbi:MAG: hypothetical protein LBM02_02415 [Lachnospiraceae bacterium]|jgi:hypothetical protein|nr:hypothetical protein [Lachnospiraceae bacterium]
MKKRFICCLGIAVLLFTMVGCSSTKKKTTTKTTSKEESVKVDFSDTDADFKDANVISIGDTSYYYSNPDSGTLKKNTFHIFKVNNEEGSKVKEIITKSGGYGCPFSLNGDIFYLFTNTQDKTKPLISLYKVEKDKSKTVVINDIKMKNIDLNKYLTNQWAKENINGKINYDDSFTYPVGYFQGKFYFTFDGHFNFLNNNYDEESYVSNYENLFYLNLHTGELKQVDKKLPINEARKYMYIYNGYIYYEHYNGLDKKDDDFYKPLGTYKLKLSNELNENDKSKVSILGTGGYANGSDTPFYKGIVQENTIFQYDLKTDKVKNIIHLGDETPYKVFQSRDDYAYLTLKEYSGTDNKQFKIYYGNLKTGKRVLVDKTSEDNQDWEMYLYGVSDGWLWYDKSIYDDGKYKDVSSYRVKCSDLNVKEKVPYK